ncbi:plasmid maintenance system antidote protein VapI [Paenibacillus sp. 1182]|uniref:helix-turn-helix transcriptional regulator n=1 Tax=Paenibacillus sp. 1182 TaxID=2806565 RepID=UPI001AEA5034|nr:helix-turn-helix transcriptional regulator [Paenibacillus sp. 1182]MBP1312274.1 plasmid maintenance system antidote protein VapI [Paenibacillus sp. 1182]
MKTALIDVDKIKKYMKEERINASHFAKQIGVSPSCLSRFLSGQREASGQVWSGLITHFGKKVFNYIFFEMNVSKDTKGDEDNTKDKPDIADQVR